MQPRPPKHTQKKYRTNLNPWDEDFISSLHHVLEESTKHLLGAFSPYTELQDQPRGEKGYGTNQNPSWHKLAPIWYTVQIPLLFCFGHWIKTVVSINSSMLWNFVLFLDSMALRVTSTCQNGWHIRFCGRLRLFELNSAGCGSQSRCPLMHPFTPSKKEVLAVSPPHWNILTFPIPVLQLPLQHANPADHHRTGSKLQRAMCLRCISWSEKHFIWILTSWSYSRKIWKFLSLLKTGWEESRCRKISCTWTVFLKTARYSLEGEHRCQSTGLV